MNTRIKKLFNEMDKQNIDVVFITDENNMYYYSGFYKGEGYLAVGKSFLCVVTDSRYTEYASSVCEGFEVKNINDVSPEDFVNQTDICGFENKSISYSMYEMLSKKIKNLVPINDMSDSIRQIKDEGEINLIKKAAKISDDAFKYICSFIKEGVTEREIASEIDCFMLKNGAEESAFSTIAVSGEKTSRPHAIPTSKKIKTGEFIVMDFGCMVNGYRSDMTRTVALGDVSDKMKEIYENVLKAQKMSLKVLKEGVTGKYVDSVARNFLDSLYPGKFTHSLGHGVGLYVHEGPNLSFRSEKVLKEGAVVTVEPGIYIEGEVGVRIEDLTVIRKDGCEILSHSPKELLIL